MHEFLNCLSHVLKHFSKMIQELPLEAKVGLVAVNQEIPGPRTVLQSEEAHSGVPG